MKNRLFLSLAAAVAIALVFGCGGSSNKNQGESGKVVAEDTHTSQNSLDYEGTYTGTLPCADCSGIYTEITLKADKYAAKYVYQGKGEEKQNTFTESGVYAWDKAGRIITLGNDTTKRYQVGENQLFALDINGQRITGQLAEKYILKKKI